MHNPERDARSAGHPPANLNTLPPPLTGKTGWPWTQSGQTGAPVEGRPPDREAWPRVTVVTPSFNQGRFIEETIRSVLLQGYPNLEYIIIDGGSTDKSVEIIRKYEPWLAYWVSEPDRGQTHAINKGWMHATGNVLAYINTDDCYLEGAIVTAAREFCAHPDAGMVYGTATIVDEAGRELRSWQARPFDPTVMLTMGNIVPQPAAFFALDALKSVGYLQEEWSMIMDYALCLSLGLRYPAICVQAPLARFRHHAQSKTSLGFETTAREVTRLVTTFTTDQIAPRDLQTIKQRTMSRVHYELALAYASQRHRAGFKALEQLRTSLRLSPMFALRRPVQTAYLMKELLLSYYRANG